MDTRPVKIRCAKCGHEDHVDAPVCMELGDDGEIALDQRALRELAQAVQATGSRAAAAALDRLFAGEPELEHVIATARAAKLRVPA